MSIRRPGKRRVDGHREPAEGANLAPGDGHGVDLDDAGVVLGEEGDEGAVGRGADPMAGALDAGMGASFGAGETAQRDVRGRPRRTRDGKNRGREERGTFGEEDLGEEGAVGGAHDTEEGET